MARRTVSKKKIDLNMTPMIDIVFQLLAFFVMTFKIVAPEGDFSIKMPPAGAPPSMEITTPPEPIQIKLSANSGGGLASINLGDRPPTRSFLDLRRNVLSMIQRRGGPDKADVEIELAPDPHLRYEYVVEAITAVTGEVKGGRVYKICDKVKFAPRRAR